MTSENTSVAIIDSGVADAATQVSFTTAPDQSVHQSKTSGDVLGHGTACAALIQRIEPAVSICSVAIIDEPGVGSLPALVAGIEWATAERVQVINVSLGVVEITRAEAERLSQVCALAVEAGIIIVAAEQNEGLISYPAHLPTVIGVRGARVFGDETYHYCPGQAIECIARGDAQRVQWLGGEQALIGGSSLAASRIAGIVARFKHRQRSAGLQQIRALLRAEASRVLAEAPTVETSMGNVASEDGDGAMRNVALYPYTKEMHSLVRFRDLLPFQISGVADPPGRGQVGKDAGESIGAAVAGLPVLASLRQAVQGADTLILGYLKQLGGLRGRDLQRECLELALEKNLQVFSFEPLLEQDYGDLLKSAQHRGLRFCWPRVSREQAEKILASRNPQHRRWTNLYWVSSAPVPLRGSSLCSWLCEGNFTSRVTALLNWEPNIIQRCSAWTTPFPWATGPLLKRLCKSIRNCSIGSCGKSVPAVARICFWWAHSPGPFHTIATIRER